MTPDLMEAGAQPAPPMPRSQARQHRRAAAAAGRPRGHRRGDFAQGVALYLDEVTVSFDGFKALNN
jgi:urea transport system ATP-binding protein